MKVSGLLAASWLALLYSVPSPAHPMQQTVLMKGTSSSCGHVQLTSLWLEAAAHSRRFGSFNVLFLVDFRQSGSTMGVSGLLCSGMPG